MSRSTSSVIESLESRQLFADMLELSSVAPINAYDGVGFQRNPVAYVTYTKDGKGVTDPSTIKAEVNYNDGSGWQMGVLAKTSTAGAYIVKGTHVYRTGTSSYPITTRVSAGTAPSRTAATTVVNLKQLSAPAARGGSPLLPVPQQGPANVQLGISNVPAVKSFTGVGFNRNAIANFAPKLNLVADKDITHYFAQVNFGDSPTWFNADVARKGTLASTYLVKNRTHVYAKAGTYPVTVVVTGPDGTTATQETTSVTVRNLSALAANPTQAAPNASIGSAKDNWMSITNVPNTTATKGKSTGEIQLGYLSAKVQGVMETSGANYQVFINWGDNGSWTAGRTTDMVGTTPMKLLGSHTYANAGTYQVTLHLIGMDGTSLTQETVLIKVV